MNGILWYEGLNKLIRDGLLRERSKTSETGHLHVQYWSLLNWQNLQLHCGGVAVSVNWFFDIISSFSLNLRTLYIVWSLVRRRVTRRLTRPKLCATFLNIAKLFKTLRCGCGAVAFIFSIYLKPVLYKYNMNCK